MSQSDLVVVTGVTGFLGGHCALELLRRGYSVRGTLRTELKADVVRRCLSAHGADVERLSFAPLDLTIDNGWDEAFSGARYVLHVASPFPKAQPKNADELIVPAREGTKRALKAATRAGVERVVLTSSTVSVVNGHGPDKTHFNESDWSNVDANISPYAKSKTIAEKAAWDFVESTANAPELTVINPCFIQGPLLDSRDCTSIEVVRRLMLRKIPGCPRIGMTVIDVRDVARAHVDAMTTPAAAGQRIICASEFMWFQDFAKTLAQHFEGQGFRIPTRALPNTLVRIAGLFDRSLRSLIPDLGVKKHISHEHLVQTFGWEPRPAAEAVIAMAESLLEYGVVQRPR